MSTLTPTKVNEPGKLATNLAREKPGKGHLEVGLETELEVGENNTDKGLRARRWSRMTFSQSNLCPICCSNVKK